MKPDIFFFNPTCEMAIANGTVSYMPNRTLTQFEKELGSLPQFFARPNDIVLVHQLPDTHFLNNLEQTGLKTPQFCEIKNALKEPAFISQPKGLLRPWGWSPRAHHLLSPLKNSCNSQFKSLPNANWHTEHKQLYSRSTALDILKKIVERDNNKNYLPMSLMPTICHTISQVEDKMKQWGQIVVKAPWSSSGRGLQVLRHQSLHPSVIQWIGGILKGQGYVMVEPWLDKVMDYSLHFYITPGCDLKQLGPAYFFTNSNGQYQGNYLGGAPDHMPKLPLDILTRDVAKAIKQSPLMHNYSGYFGVDGIMFRNSQNQLLIHPCLEINLRYTMGTLSLFLEKKIHPLAKGTFEIYFQGGKTFDKFHEQMRENYPFQSTDGLWRKGYFPLVSPYSSKIFGAYILLK